MDELHLSLATVMPVIGECPACGSRLRDTMRGQAGVQDARYDPTRDELWIAFDPDRVSRDALLQAAHRASETLAHATTHRRLPIGGMDCADCAATLERSVAAMKGVSSVRVHFATGVMLLEYDPALIDLPAIRNRVESLGYTIREGDGQQVTVFRVEGMDCADCATKLADMVENLEQVLHAEVNFGAGLLTVTHAGPEDVAPRVSERAAEAGYTVRLHRAVAAPAPVVSGWKRWLPRNVREWRTWLSGLGLLAGGLARWAGAPELVSIAFLAFSVAVGGWPIARAGWAALRTTRSLDMNVLMTLAVVGAMFIGEWTEAATVVFLFAVGTLLESRTMDRARQSIRALMSLTPSKATRMRGEHTEEVLVEHLSVGDRILVRPGERIPMDGLVEAGHTFVNQAPITGESMPVTKEPGETVFAGTINGDGAIEVHVTRPAADNTLARIVRMVEEAQGRRAPSQRFVDRFSRIYTPAVIALAVGIAVIPPALLGAPFLDWLYRALILLVISCPCALVVSTPVTVVSAITNAARQGILIKGGAYLEAAGALQAIAFDKTGTLTRGAPALTDVISLNGHTREQLLTIAAAIEGSSEHALAAPIMDAARQSGLATPRADDFRALAGRGASARIDGSSYLIGSPLMMGEHALLTADAASAVGRLHAEGKTVTLVACQDGCDLAQGAHLIGIIGLADELRDEAPAAIAGLKAEGIAHTVMLTGDSLAAGRAAAQRIGIDDVRAELLPHQKVEAVEDLAARYGQTAMVGDGVNDAPALARADVGIVMGAMGTDVALETADIALMSDDLTKIPALIRLSRRARRVIGQNIALALALKALFLGLALAGQATLWMAVFADVGASLIVTLNGMRLLSRQTE
jgi:Zn2+/Cd2+-exporting ATPase